MSLTPEEQVEHLLDLLNERSLELAELRAAWDKARLLNQKLKADNDALRAILNRRTQHVKRLKTKVGASR